MASGVRNKFGAPMFEPEVFLRKQMYCIEESTCDIVGTSQRPHSGLAPPAVIRRPRNDSAPGELCLPASPSLRPWLH